MKQPFFLVRQRFILTNAILDPPRFLEKHDQASLHEDSVFAHTATMYWLTVDHLGTSAPRRVPPAWTIVHTAERS